MVSFIFYDLVFLALFSIAVVIFLSKRRKNLERQGIIYLYKTKFGLVFMDKFAKKFKKILKPLQYLVLISGYILTIGVLYLIIKSVYIYFTDPLITQLIKAPPVAPLIPYFPTLFGLDAFFPPLYFTYFIIALAVVALVHEGAHGIFARLNKIKIHSTGFVFLGPILGAFVEQDEKQMNSSKKFPQLVVLAAGTFANVITAIVFGLLLWGFFSAVFSPAGMYFNTYAGTSLELSELNIPDNFSLENEYIEVIFNNEKYFIPPIILKNSIDNNAEFVIAYHDSPALNAKLKGAITKINGNPINSFEELGNELDKYSPGEVIKIQTAQLDGVYDTSPEFKEFEITLAENNGKAFLGIGVIPRSEGRFFTSVISIIRDPFTYYESSWGNFGWFIYFLFWWLFVINILVAFFNMLPLGILDGGRFFMLTLWGITGSEKIGRKSYRIIHWLILLAFIALMLKWVGIFIN